MANQQPPMPQQQKYSDPVAYISLIIRGIIVCFVKKEPKKKHGLVVMINDDTPTSQQLKQKDLLEYPKVVFRNITHTWLVYFLRNSASVLNTPCMIFVDKSINKEITCDLGF